MRRNDIWLYLGPADRAELQALITNRNTALKLVWRAEIVLATAGGHGTFEIMRRVRTSKPTVWRWQGRYLDEGVAGFKRDKTRPSRVPPLPMETRLKVITKTGAGDPAECHPLELLEHGRGGRHFAFERRADLGRGGSQAAYHQGVQGLERSALRGKGHRDRGALH